MLKSKQTFLEIVALATWGSGQWVTSGMRKGDVQVQGTAYTKFCRATAKGLHPQQYQQERRLLASWGSRAMLVLVDMLATFLNTGHWAPCLQPKETETPNLEKPLDFDPSNIIFFLFFPVLLRYNWYFISPKCTTWFDMCILGNDHNKFS